MVSFNWSWADYERCKREEERKAAREAARSRYIDGDMSDPPPAPSAKPAPSPASPHRVGEVFDSIMAMQRAKREALAAQQAQRQRCDLCGKMRLGPCDDRGCPIL